jgi:alkanesulfonate monooxygenase SsuD/methylene tetrahydromethanopterin reductase-like flavin-dependent oxidoreductase (luciferase family)
LKRWAAEFDKFQHSWFRSSGEVVAQEIELAPPDQRQFVTEMWSSASGDVDGAKERARKYATGFIPLYKAANGDLQQFRDDIDTASAAFAKALDRVNLLLGYDIDREVKQWYHFFGRST